MRVFPLIAFVILAIACQATPAPPVSISPTPPPETLRIGLTSSAARLVDLVTEPYDQQTDQALLQFVIANTQTLFTDLDNGQLDAILVHHIPAGNGRWFNPVALDGLVIITHPDNPVPGLELVEAQAIFNGRLTNWQLAGGPDQPVTLLSREPEAGTHAILSQRVMAEQRIHINAQIQASDGAMQTAVAADPSAIGFSMMGNTTGVRLLAIDNHQPTPATTADQSYPLTVPLYFVAAETAEPQGELRAFLAWLQSDDGQTIIEERYGRVQ